MKKEEKEKRSVSTRRIQKIIDNIQAMTRNPEYRQDFLLWQSEKMHDLEIMFKYGIAFVLDPNLPLLKSAMLKPYENLDPQLQKSIQEEFRDFFIREWRSQSVYIVDQNKDWITEMEDGKLHFDYKKRLRDGRFLTIEIDLSQKKDYIQQAVEELIDTYSKYVVKDSDRDTPGRVINRFLVWDEYNCLKSFKKISEQYKCNASTIRKAYLRAFSDIMLEDYDPNSHNRGRLTKAQLQKTCDTCPEYNECNVPCPQVLAFVEQDKYVRPCDALQKTMFTNKTENIKDSKSPEEEIEKSELLSLINKALNKNYTSLAEALNSLSKKDLSILQKDPRIIAYNNQ